jgi:omega-6 fatty acid desaturase (delta-12 desaturase)
MNTQLERISSSTAGEKSWQAVLAQHRTPSLHSSIWQLVNTLIPFIVICYVIYLSLAYSYWLTLALAPVAAGFHVRLFIIFHDCTHNAFFKSQRANAVLGTICGFICFTPYYHWRHFHALHHATTGNLTKRLEGEIVPLTFQKCMETNGDILTLTVKEYLQLSLRERLVYRLYRQLLLCLFLMPLVMFVVLHRLANSKAGKRERHSVHWTNLAILSLSIGLSLLIGVGPLLMIGLPIIAISGTAGVWLFYVQHQFEETYWEPQGEWNFMRASLQGSSYYKLPRILQWFTGNIGFHHIHHLNPRIPNYHLEKCHQASPLFFQTRAVTLGSGLKSFFFRLWDEEQHKMVSFAQLKLIQREGEHRELP